MHTKIVKILPTLSIFLLALFLFTGCASMSAMRPLNKDTFTADEGFTSIAFWRLRIVDRTFTFYQPPYFQIINLIQKDGKLTMDTMAEPKVRKSWTKKPDASYFDELFIFEAKPGKQDFYNIVFSDNVGFAYPSRYSSQLVVSTSFMPIDQSCVIVPGKLVYLGVFNYEIVRKDGSIQITYQISQKDDDFNNDMKMFQERYPLLYAQFNDKVEKAAWRDSPHKR